MQGIVYYYGNNLFTAVDGCCACVFYAGGLTLGIISVSGCMITHMISGLFIKQTWTITRAGNSRWVCAITSHLWPCVRHIHDHLDSATLLCPSTNTFYCSWVFIIFTLFICTELMEGIFRYLTIRFRLQCNSKMFFIHFDDIFIY